MKRLLSVALITLAALVAGCQFEEPTLGGTILSIQEVDPGEGRKDPVKFYEDPLVPEVAWKVEVRLDQGAAVTVLHTGSRRYAPGERVRLLVDSDGALLL